MKLFNCRHFINGLVLAGFLSTTPTLSFADMVTIFTPNKTAITANGCSEMSDDAIVRLDLEYEILIKNHKWDVVVEESSSCQYNSHGYAWHMMQGGEPVEIDAKDIPKYWLDGSYRQIEKDQAKSGDIIVMSDPLEPDSIHSAVIVDSEWCRSKWADGPLVLHRWDHHPFGKTYRYYRRAKRVAPPAPTNLRIITSP